MYQKLSIYRCNNTALNTAMADEDRTLVILSNYKMLPCLSHISELWIALILNSNNTARSHGLTAITVTSLKRHGMSIVCSTACRCNHQRQCFEKPLSVDSLYKGIVIQKLSTCHDVIMYTLSTIYRQYMQNYHQVSNIRRTLFGKAFVDNSDVVGASPVGAAPTTSSLSI